MTRTPKPPPTFTHAGRLGYTGYYAIGIDAIRTPGQIHALNAIPGQRAYRALCGVVVPVDSDDHHDSGQHWIYEATGPASVGCQKCRKILRLKSWRVEFRPRPPENSHPLRPVEKWQAKRVDFASRSEAEDWIRRRQPLYRATEYRIREPNDGGS